MKTAPVSHIAMNTSPEFDRTDTPEFIEEHMDRILGWEILQTCLIRHETLQPSRIADRCGVPTEVIKDILNAPKLKR